MSAQKGLLETPFLDVKVKNLGPWLQHYRGQYSRLSYAWYSNRYFGSSCPKRSAMPFLHLTFMLLGVNTMVQNQKNFHDAFFDGTGTEWDHAKH
eukprot:CAMPEP_0201487228 /NCGR_PEP_ID=MMETSP0151_2-20130828/11658_1 /ASSEMBLY_ACC=CAM_ASM_000257 /TAXON_ID=200890 /ORGANISM="Paramoeba atlantica, Strain 621/1 / CCAP 1560/9" /LENGTH=93 /DNA_ID=CAMNT_0047872213 /DNA_START=52 /DNA_END=333 /DNA_ORIENTATION=+